MSDKPKEEKPVEKVEKTEVSDHLDSLTLHS